MLLNWWLILGACVAGVIFGLLVSWIIIKIQNTLRSNPSNSMEIEKQTRLAIQEDLRAPSPEQPLCEANHAPDIQKETDNETDNDWLNNEVREVSANTLRKSDDDWLNAGVEEVSAQIYKQQDDNWLNAEDNQSLEAVNESSLNRATTNHREIQIEQDGSIFHITVTASNNQATKPEQTMINLRINVSPQRSARKSEEPYAIEMTSDGSFPPYFSLQDILTVKTTAEPLNQNPALMDEISVRPVENRFTKSYALLDEILVRHVESQVIESYALMDDISVRPVELQVTESYALMDQISVRPVERHIIESYPLMDELAVRTVEMQVTESYAPVDEISVRPEESQVTEGNALMDEIFIKPSPSPLNIEYELLDDLITKNAPYRTKKEKPLIELVIINPVEKPVEKVEPTGDVVIINSVEIPVEEEKLSSDLFLINPVEGLVEKAAPVKPITMQEITEMLKEERNLKQATISSAATGKPKLSILSLDIRNIAARFKVLRFGLVCLIAMAIAELLVYRIYPVGGMVIYFGILFSLIINCILTKDQSQRHFSIALGLAPLIRIILLAVPAIPAISQYLWYIIASIPIIAGIISISRMINLSPNDIGLNFNKPFIQLLAAITGIGLAIVDYLILKPIAWTNNLTIQEVLLPAIVLLIFTGLVEELSFRGVMQRASVVVGSYGWIFIAAVYGVLQIWQGSVLHCVFCFGVSLIFGWIVKKTRSIIGVSLAHGFINIGLYLILPHIV